MKAGKNDKKRLNFIVLSLLDYCYRKQVIYIFQLIFLQLPQ